MRIDVVLRYVGLVMLFIAAFMLLSAGISYLLKNTTYYEWGDNKNEQAAKAYWEKIKGRKL